MEQPPQNPKYFAKAEGFRCIALQMGDVAGLVAGQVHGASPHTYEHWQKSNYLLPKDCVAHGNSRSKGQKSNYLLPKDCVAHGNSRSKGQKSNYLLPKDCVAHGNSRSKGQKSNYLLPKDCVAHGNSRSKGMAEIIRVDFGRLWAMCV